jgi:hypothetical protein
MKRREFLGGAGALGVAGGIALNDLLALASVSDLASETSPTLRPPTLAVHPENPKYFVFRGKPWVLIAASEHYGSIVNRRFDFERYLKEAAGEKQTVTRTFLLYREQQSSRNPYSPIKPESPDFITPWPRTGPGRAADGEPKYDLERWNPEYFARLHRFLGLASRLDIVVELTVFSNTYAQAVWELNPLHSGNNLQGVGNIKWQDYLSLQDSKLVEWQIRYARKIVEETSVYDNIYYEICNEPGGGFSDHPAPAEVDAWQQMMAKVLREEMQKLNRPHLLAGQNAFTYKPEFSQAFDASFSGTMLDVVNVHPLPGLSLRGQTYQLGNFMSKELQLEPFRDFFLAAYQAHKPVVSDEDNAASLYLDDVGWTIDRKRAWTAVLCGSHYDYIDFSIQANLEAGTEESRKKIRSWMKNLSEFIHSFDFIRARPQREWIVSKPEHLVDASLVIEGRDYIVYLADNREVSNPNAGKPIGGKLSLRLPPGEYGVSFYSPVSGEHGPSIQVHGGPLVAFDCGPFTHDIVVRATASGP